MGLSSNNNVRFFLWYYFLHPDERVSVWSNNENFLPNQNTPPGYVLKFLLLDLFIHNNGHHDSFDPIIGQGPSPKTMSGFDPLDEKRILTLKDFVIPKGGEYFFSPSLKALKETIGKAWYNSLSDIFSCESELDIEIVH